MNARTANSSTPGRVLRWIAGARAAFQPKPRIGDVITIKGDSGWDRPSFRMHLCHGRDQVARSAAKGWAVFEAPMPQHFARAVAAGGAGSVIDVGANTGFYTLLALAVCRSVTVTAYEPMPQVRALLAANLRLDAGRRRVAVRPQAASDRNGPCTLFVPDASHGLVETSASLSQAFKGGSGCSMQIEAATLDALHGETLKITVIKIDAESHDLAVLLGAEQILLRHRPIVFFEVLLGADEAGLTRMLQRTRYVDIVLHPDGPTDPSATVKHDTDAWNHMWLPAEAAASWQSPAPI